jgi:hypothetical protein
MREEKSFEENDIFIHRVMRFSWINATMKLFVVELFGSIFPDFVRWNTEKLFLLMIFVGYCLHLLHPQAQQVTLFDANLVKSFSLN